MFPCAPPSRRAVRYILNGAADRGMLPEIRGRKTNTLKLHGAGRRRTGYATGRFPNPGNSENIAESLCSRFHQGRYMRKTDMGLRVAARVTGKHRPKVHFVANTSDLRPFTNSRSSQRVHSELSKPCNCSSIVASWRSTKTGFRTPGKCPSITLVRML